MRGGLGRAARRPGELEPGGEELEAAPQVGGSSVGVRDRKDSSARRGPEERPGSADHRQSLNFIPSARRSLEPF